MLDKTDAEQKVRSPAQLLRLPRATAAPNFPFDFRENPTKTNLAIV